MPIRTRSDFWQVPPHRAHCQRLLPHGFAMQFPPRGWQFHAAWIVGSVPQGTVSPIFSCQNMPTLWAVIYPGTIFWFICWISIDCIHMDCNFSAKTPTMWTIIICCQLLVFTRKIFLPKPPHCGLLQVFQPTILVLICFDLARFHYLDEINHFSCYDHKTYIVFRQCQIAKQQKKKKKKKIFAWKFLKQFGRLYPTCVNIQELFINQNIGGFHK